MPTCIVAVVDEEGAITMGGDRAVSYAGTSFTTGEPKVFELVGEEAERFIIGCSGAIRAINPIQHGFIPPRHKEGVADMLYMITVFLPALQKAMKVTRAIYAENGRVDADVWALVGYRNNLYTFDAFEIVWINDAEFATGSGMEFALGSLYTTSETDLSPVERITWALEASAYYNPFVSEPFDIMTLPGIDTEG
jgi:ATP-dependent protease HslVU (ClpYQ) peptidase subunit